VADCTYETRYAVADSRGSVDKILWKLEKPGVEDAVDGAIVLS
jgi:hypothetical protein